ncbi:hypothetical protein L596_010565 [Steinernema carpocapsae]|uniref:Uncharacterized protein n=1 Tax=Steinernema carpocapsae TaxID=34508 RepID=A0A4U5PK33_STECR|nr:hypothetical protein L596_010565 [Steinernema carpocapsae]
MKKASAKSQPTAVGDTRLTRFELSKHISTLGRANVSRASLSRRAEFHTESITEESGHADPFGVLIAL